MIDLINRATNAEMLSEVKGAFLDDERDRVIAGERGCLSICKWRLGLSRHGSVFLLYADVWVHPPLPCQMTTAW
jgi:hypothetical protein